MDAPIRVYYCKESERVQIHTGPIMEVTGKDTIFVKEVNKSTKNSDEGST